jgi:hypothetical protein
LAEKLAEWEFVDGDCGGLLVFLFEGLERYIRAMFRAKYVKPTNGDEFKVLKSCRKTKISFHIFKT